MRVHRARAEQEQTCALRALTICDGQELEQPDHAVASCLCWLESASEDAGYPLVAQGCREQRDAFLAVIPE